MSEGSLQRYFKRQAKTHGVFWVKVQAVGQRGFPDVLIAYGGKLALVELKNPNKKGRLSKLQERQIKKLTDAGIAAQVIDSREDIDTLIRSLTHL